MSSHFDTQSLTLRGQLCDDLVGGVSAGVKGGQTIHSQGLEGSENDLSCVESQALLQEGLTNLTFRRAQDSEY